MIDISDSERQRAFSVWLRTGRLPSLRDAAGTELKFNPWHDLGTGRFTFAGAGHYYAAGSGGGRAGRARVPTARPAQPSQPRGRAAAGRAIWKEPNGQAPSGGKGASARKPPAEVTWGGGGFTGGGGGDFGGAGAQAAEDWGWDWPKRKFGSSNPQGVASGGAISTPATTTNPVSARPAASAEASFRTVVRNGYTYEIDARERTRHVSGTLTVAPIPVRSRTSQGRAGGVDRRASDDGGHYIAARFAGPTDAFNHFAQNANFNRGGYRLLEDEWAREKRTGRKVTVRMVPQFDGGSLRPSAINVWWTVDGEKRSTKFPNERSEKSRGK